MAEQATFGSGGSVVEVVASSQYTGEVDIFGHDIDCFGHLGIDATFYQVFIGFADGCNHGFEYVFKFVRAGIWGNHNSPFEYLVGGRINLDNS